MSDVLNILLHEVLGFETTIIPLILFCKVSIFPHLSNWTPSQITVPNIHSLLAPPPPKVTIHVSPMIVCVCVYSRSPNFHYLFSISYIKY